MKDSCLHFPTALVSCTIKLQIIAESITDAAPVYRPGLVARLGRSQLEAPLKPT